MKPESKGQCPICRKPEVKFLDVYSSETWLQTYAIKCPSCGIHTQKAGGCNEVTCFCGCPFWYSTGRCHDCGRAPCTCARWKRSKCILKLQAQLSVLTLCLFAMGLLYLTVRVSSLKRLEFTGNCHSFSVEFEEQICVLQNVYHLSKLELGLACSHRDDLDAYKLDQGITKRITLETLVDVILETKVGLDMSPNVLFKMYTVKNKWFNTMAICRI
jgi:hypothetical protein